MKPTFKGELVAKTKAAFILLFPDSAHFATGKASSVGDWVAYCIIQSEDATERVEVSEMGPTARIEGPVSRVEMSGRDWRHALARAYAAYIAADEQKAPADLLNWLSEQFANGRGLDSRWVDEIERLAGVAEVERLSIGEGSDETDRERFGKAGGGNVFG